MITLYLDMDGVLCNFDKAYRKLDPDKSDRKRFREAVLEHNIFETLEFMPDAHELLNHVSTLDDVKIEILTSLGTYDYTQGSAARRQKLNWLINNKIYYDANFVHSKIEKAKYACKKCILIDDSFGCVDPFNEKGGYAILHTSAKQSIIALQTAIASINIEMKYA